MIPFLPIIMAVASIGAGVASGISAVQSAKAQAEAVHKQTQTQINERAKQARKLMSQQKTSFLKGGVYFQGTPEDVINETYNTSVEDINAMKSDANNTIRNLRRQANSGFWSSTAQGVANGALGFYTAGGLPSISNSYWNTKIWSVSRKFGTIGDFSRSSGGLISPSSSVIA